MKPYADAPFVLPGKVRRAKLLRDRHNGEARPYVLSLLTFFRRVKKVSRLPAGTGELDLKVSRNQIFQTPNYIIPFPRTSLT